jgi:hypothetical protein
MKNHGGKLKADSNWVIERGTAEINTKEVKRLLSLFAERLIAECWLKEGAVGDLPRGRRPTFLHLNTERCGVVGVDIQPATTTLTVSSMDSQFLAQESMQFKIANKINDLSIFPMGWL